MRRFALVLLVACGSDDASPLTNLPDNCFEIAGKTSFALRDFEPAAPGSLAGWNPDGRWTTTAPLPYGGELAIHFQRNGNRVTVNRGQYDEGTIDDTTLLFAPPFPDQPPSRISNLQPDGSLRLETPLCFGGACTMCTNTLVRAAPPAGEAEGSGLTLVGQYSDPAWTSHTSLNVRVAGTLAYLIRRDALSIIDTTDPARPVEVGQYRRVGTPFVNGNDVKLIEVAGRRYALIASSPVDIVDVTDPAATVLVAQIPVSTHTLFTETRNGATLVYLGANASTCDVYDVTNPLAPRRVSRYDTQASIVHDLSVVDGIAYLNAWERGFFAVDFTNLAAPKLLGRWGPTPIGSSHSNWTTVVNGKRVALHGEEGFGAHLHMVDVEPGSPTFMQPIGEWETRPWVSIHNIMAFGNKGYFTYYQDGVRVVDVAAPAQPKLIGYYNTWDGQAAYASNAFFEGALGLDVDQARKLVFVADTPRGLLILRDATP